MAEQTLTIDRLGHLGDGIAEGPIFVARTLPGEVVQGEVTGGRIAAPRVLVASDHRIKPPCPHYGACGGCSLLHADDDFVADWKVGVVRGALAAQGLIDAPTRPILTSPPRSRRRAALSGRRTKKGAVVGFHARQSDVVTAVPDCHVLSDALRRELPLLERITRLGASRKGEMSFAVIGGPAGLDVAVSDAKPLDRALSGALVREIADSAIVRLSWNGEVLVQHVPPALRFGPGRVVPPPGAFLQATAEGEAALLAAVREAVGDTRRVADLFAGCGTFALPLSEGAEVHAAEGDADLVEALVAGWRAVGGLRALSAEARDLFRRPLMRDELTRFDAVVIDPPRAGAAAQTAELATSDVARIASVSCNPVSFARDAATLVSGGYQLDWVQPVDQFRWSPHIEIAAQFSRL